MVAFVELLLHVLQHHEQRESQKSHDASQCCWLGVRGARVGILATVGSRTGEPNHQPLYDGRLHQQHVGVPEELPVFRCECLLLCVCRVKTGLLCLLQVGSILCFSCCFFHLLMTPFCFSFSQSVTYLPVLRGRGFFSIRQFETRELPVPSQPEGGEEERWVCS